MKRLILMRHAKSDWSSRASSDHDRPLNTRGRAAATALGEWLHAEGLVPDEVLCSSAERTGETLRRLGVPQGAQINFTRALYLATHQEIMASLQGATGGVALVVGHNPGISIFAEQVLAQRPDHPQFDRYPTGATLVADFDIANWAEADWQNATARHFVVPRDL